MTAGSAPEPILAAPSASAGPSPTDAPTATATAMAAQTTRERALAEERDHLAMALAAGGLGLWSWDRPSRRISWGEGLATMFGLDPACLPETIHAWLEIVHPEDRNRVVTAMAAASTERGIGRVEYRIVCPDDKVRWLECSGRVIVDDHDVVVGAVGVMADVTSRRETQIVSESLPARFEILATVGLTLAEAQGVDARLSVLSAAVVPVLADWCAVYLVGDEGRPVLTATHHGDPARRAGFEQELDNIAVSTDQAWGPGAVIASGSVELIPEIDGATLGASCDDGSEVARSCGPLGLRSLLTVPLRASTHTVGALSLGRTRSGPWTGDDQKLAIELGQRAGTLIDNARLLDAERQALAASDAARSRLALLAELSIALSSTLDLDPVLDRLAALMVPRFADICIVDLQDEIIGDRLAAVAATDPEAKSRFEDAERRLPRRRNPTSSLTRTLDTGRPTLIADCTEMYLAMSTPDPEVASIYHQLGLSSILVVPLVARGGILGAITLLRRDNGQGRPRHYDEADVDLAAQIADRAAVALDNARLYTAEHRVAEQLQRGLLPK
ncbi:MAG: GAF domain-containing protein, partial [Actinomycetota bacterium]|nr:GAF domain-containing protein [Actinomycetota bacterium]